MTFSGAVKKANGLCDNRRRYAYVYLPGSRYLIYQLTDDPAKPMIVSRGQAFGFGNATLRVEEALSNKWKASKNDPVQQEATQ